MALPHLTSHNTQHPNPIYTQRHAISSIDGILPLLKAPAVTTTPGDGGVLRFAARNEFSFAHSEPMAMGCYFEPGVLTPEDGELHQRLLDLASGSSATTPPAAEADADAATATDTPAPWKTPRRRTRREAAMTSIEKPFDATKSHVSVRHFLMEASAEWLQTASETTHLETLGSGTTGAFFGDTIVVAAPPGPACLRELLEHYRERSGGLLDGHVCVMAAINRQKADDPGARHSPHFDPKAFSAVATKTLTGEADFKLHEQKKPNPVALEQRLDANSDYVMAGKALTAFEVRWLDLILEDWCCADTHTQISHMLPALTHIRKSPTCSNITYTQISHML
jgi:hypothetical protein